MAELDSNDPESLKQKLNRDTAKINWLALLEHQQNEAVVEVDASLDLIQVACEFVQDNKKQVAQWLQSELIAKVSDEKSASWQQQDRVVWAVVVAPWVLVQQPGSQ